MDLEKYRKENNVPAVDGSNLYYSVNSRKNR